jgi:hemoglobin
MRKLAWVPLLLISAAPLQDKTLYERLGGVRTIAVMVDEVVDASYKNETILSNPKVKELFEKSPPAVQKFQVTLFICEVTGGPYKYSGRSMEEAHKGLGITQEQFGALGGTVKAVMDKNKIPEDVQKEFTDLLGKYQGVVVEVAPPK